MFPVKTQGSFQGIVDAASHSKLFDVNRVRDYRHLARLDASGKDIAPQSIADGCDRIRVFQRIGFNCARKSITKATLTGTAVIDRGILPECAHFIYDGHAKPPADPQRRNRIQHGRMCMQHVGLDALHDGFNAVRGLAHQLDFSHPGH